MLGRSSFDPFGSIGDDDVEPGGAGREFEELLGNYRDRRIDFNNGEGGFGIPAVEKFHE